MLPIEDWETELPTLDFKAALFTLFLYDGNDLRPHDVLDRSGLYQLVDASQPLSQLIGLYDIESDTWRQGEYYGLRFLADKKASRLTAVRHNSADDSFAVLRSQRWPEIYERSLVLASACLPRISGDWLVYKEIPIDLATTLSSKLGLRLE